MCSPSWTLLPPHKVKFSAAADLSLASLSIQCGWWCHCLLPWAWWKWTKFIHEQCLEWRLVHGKCSKCTCHCYGCVLSHFSRVRLPATLWTVEHQTPLSMGFSRQEYWSGLLCPPPGDLPDPGIEPVSLMCPALAGGFFTTSATWGHHYTGVWNIKISKAIYWIFLCILLK